MSWKYVYNGSLGGWGCFEDCYQHAKDAGYDYFTWKDVLVYNVKSRERTYLSVDDLF